MFCKSKHSLGGSIVFRKVSNRYFDAEAGGKNDVYQKECDAERPAWTDSGGEFLVVFTTDQGENPLPLLDGSHIM